jgi:hypothetical protein
MYSPTDDEDKLIFRLIDEAQWGNGENPVSTTAISKVSTSRLMDKSKNYTEDVTVSNNEGGIAYPTLVTCQTYHRLRGSAPPQEIQVEINNNNKTTSYYMSGTTHIHFIPAHQIQPSAIGHEYTHWVEEGWEIDPAQNYMEEGSCHWGAAVALGNPNLNITFPGIQTINIDISDDALTNGGPPANILIRDEFQIAGTYWDLIEGHVWSTLKDGGFWWWQHPDTPKNFYTYYKDRDSRTSPTIKNVFKAHNYSTAGWPGKDGKDPNNFTGNYSDSKIDENADGFAEYLEVVVELDINEAGYYYVFGEIAGLDYGSSNYLHLDVGTQDVPLRFYGEHIFEAALDGPYTFSGFLADEDYNTVDYRLNAYTTAAYDYTEFKLPALFFTGNSSDSGIDTDSDGFYDELRVTAEVNVVESGDYQIYGYLYGDANFIDEASVLGHLDVGIQSVQLTFEGKTIYASNLDGPYEVALSIPRGQEIYTGAYSHTDFIKPGAYLNHIASDSGTDTDSDGLYDYLTVEVAVDCNSGGDYMLSGYLYDTTQSHITSAYTSALLSTGTQNLQLNFDGISIRNEGKDGPYGLTIELRDDDGVLIGTKTGTTSNYTHAQFQMAQQDYFQTTFTDFGTDTGSNGLYDFLTMDVAISSNLKTGIYRLDGYLYDQNDNFVTSDSAVAYVDAAINTVQLNFSGQHIWMSKIKNNTFDLDVEVFDSNDTLIVVLEDVYTTSIYDYLNFEPPVAVFQGTLSEYGRDTNGDGYYENLMMDVGIDVQKADTYRLSGTLFDGNDVEIESTRTVSYLDTGSQSLTLAFDGPSLYRHGMNGPYYLSLALYDSNDVLVDLDREAHTTEAYDYTQFQRPPVVLTGNYSDNAIDLNSDGVYEYLRVDVEVIVANAGNYALNARLMDQAENEIVWASTTAWLPADEFRTMQLNFSGPSIYGHGVNGPYYVRDVYVYKMSNTSLSDYVYDAYTTTAHWKVANEPPIANAGSDQTVERTSIAGANVQLDGSDSNDPEDDPLSYEWTWTGGSASGINPAVTLPMGLTIITLTVSDGELSDTDTVHINVVDTTHPVVNVVEPLTDLAVQDGITLAATASDISGVDEVYFCIREPNDGNGVPIGQEDLAGTFNPATGKWQFAFDTTVLPDGYYVVLAKAVDSYGNEGWSEVVPFSIRNWAIIKLLPATPNSKAGRTMPVKFSIRIAQSVDPAMPFVYNEDLEIRIYKSTSPSVILQRSLFGTGATDYRIDTTGEKYITNFKTSTTPATYVVEIWRPQKNFKVGSFTFKTVK